MTCLPCSGCWDSVQGLTTPPGTVLAGPLRAHASTQGSASAVVAWPSQSPRPAKQGGPWGPGFRTLPRDLMSATKAAPAQQSCRRAADVAAALCLGTYLAGLLPKI